MAFETSSGGGPSEGDSPTTDQPGTSEPTLADLQDRARELDIEGRSSMNKEEIETAIAEAEAAATSEPEGPAEVEAPEETSGRPPLAEVAEERVTTRRVRKLAPREEE
jgi:hypothetical protein